MRTVIFQAEDMACATVLVQGSMSQERKGSLGVCVGNESDGTDEDGEKGHSHNGFKGLSVELESFPDGSAVKNLPAMQETLVRSLGWENPLIPWRRAWQPAPVFLPGESYGHRSLVGSSP